MNEIVRSLKPVHHLHKNVRTVMSQSSECYCSHSKANRRRFIAKNLRKDCAMIVCPVLLVKRHVASSIKKGGPSFCNSDVSMWYCTFHRFCSFKLISIFSQEMGHQKIEVERALMLFFFRTLHRKCCLSGNILVSRIVTGWKRLTLTFLVFKGIMRQCY